MLMQIVMGVKALHTMGVVLPIPSPLHFLFKLPFPSFPLPFPTPSPLIQLEGLGSTPSSPAGPGIFGVFRGAIKRIRGHVSCMFLTNGT